MAKSGKKQLMDSLCRILSERPIAGILVGYSGGADSSALLRLLWEYCSKRGIYLCAVHVHHGIRGTEADRDAAFCKAQCEHLSVDFFCEYADVPTLAKESGRGIEETARDCRYAAFAKIAAADARISHIATAHNADDQAETVLLHLIRGCGIDGLCGIPTERTLDGVTVIRPLIGVSKCDIVGYCAENRIEYILDSTNSDTAYARNFVRHELLPGILHLNPSALTAISRMTAALSEDSEYLASEAAAFFAENVRENAIDAAVLAHAPRPIAARTVAMLFAQLSEKMPERVHIDAVLALASAENGASVSLPDGITATKHNGTLRLSRETTASPFCYPLKPGINRFSEPDFAVYLTKRGASGADFKKDNEYLKNIYKLSIHTSVNSAKIKGELFVRSRMDGDAYRYGGMTRRIKKLCNDRGLSAVMRAHLPMICDGDGILWVPGFGTADRVCGGEELLDMIYYYN
ncbi:MAG: tRNA lysidine(34) synthetase TilS [Ruminococcaceae bacterium]|nr:tRNA lysidine(34) synthetase TilS [Oscillospiraceae bacterium]